MPQSSVATCSTPTARASSSGPPARPPAALPRAVAHGAGLFGFRSEGCNPNGTFVRTLARPGPLPARVSDLRVTQAGEQTVRLEWTRPGAAAAGTLADRYRIVQRSASPPLVDFRPASRVVARGCPTPRPRAPAPPRACTAAAAAAMRIAAEGARGEREPTVAERGPLVAELRDCGRAAEADFGRRAVPTRHGRMGAHALRPAASLPPPSGTK